MANQDQESDKWPFKQSSKDEQKKKLTPSTELELKTEKIAIRNAQEKSKRVQRKEQKKFIQNLRIAKRQDLSLKNLSRLQIVKKVKYGNIDELPLPKRIKMYLKFDLPKQTSLPVTTKSSGKR